MKNWLKQRPRTTDSRDVETKFKYRQKYEIKYSDSMLFLCNVENRVDPPEYSNGKQQNKMA